MQGGRSATKRWDAASRHGGADLDSRAERWLCDIQDFIAQDNPAAATRTIETLYQKAEILREFPESGYRYWQRPDWHIRILLHGHYRIAYVLKSSDAIDILGVFHGALSIDRYLP